MKISSRTPVKVKRQSCIVWMMEDPESECRSADDATLDGGARKDETNIDGSSAASSSKRSFVDEVIVQSREATPSQQVKKAKVEKEVRTLKPKGDPSLSQPASKSSVSLKAKASTKKKDEASSSFSQKICSSFGCGAKTKRLSEWHESSSSSSSSFDTVAVGSGHSFSSSDISSYGMTPKVYYYSRHTTWRLRNSSPNRHSPLIARQLRF